MILYLFLLLFLSCNSVALAGLGLDRIKQRPGLVVGLGPGCRLQSNTKKASAWLSLAKPIKHAVCPSLAGLWLARAWLPSQALQGHEIKHAPRVQDDVLIDTVSVLVQLTHRDAVPPVLIRTNCLRKSLSRKEPV
jgi:hypothetical protein